MLNSANAFYVMAFPNLITYYYYFHNYYDQILSLKIDSYALTFNISFRQFSVFHIFHRHFFRGNKAMKYFSKRLSLAFI